MHQQLIQRSIMIEHQRLILKHLQDVYCYFYCIGKILLLAPHPPDLASFLFLLFISEFVRILLSSFSENVTALKRAFLSETHLKIWAADNPNRMRESLNELSEF